MPKFKIIPANSFVGIFCDQFYLESGIGIKRKKQGMPLIVSKPDSPALICTPTSLMQQLTTKNVTDQTCAWREIPMSSTKLF
ncbi:hypothetical protein [uncultured Bartonella sp.]|uniref:hypothetical protein n=1 Tax=uncultured Bartonella sp. TaxID=104108 RepID=UPI0025DF793B|nr:hypothetical protein [uncultured Bartonella sp.]